MSVADSAYRIRSTVTQIENNVDSTESLVNNINLTFGSTLNSIQATANRIEDDLVSPTGQSIGASAANTSNSTGQISSKMANVVSDVAAIKTSTASIDNKTPGT